MSEKSLVVFAHLNVEKTELYRRILRVFMEAKASFLLHLRPSDVAATLHNDQVRFDGDPSTVEVAFSQLCEWGNLEAHRDHSEVATAEDFYRPRFLYQL